MSEHWEIVKSKTELHWLELICINGDNGKDVPSYSAYVKFDGCIGFTRYFNGETKDSDSIHICDIDKTIELLQELKQKALTHFGSDWS